MSAPVRDHFFELLHHFKYGMLTTHGASGELHARPMALAHVDEVGDLWLLSDIQSEKVGEIACDDRVSVSMQAGQRFVAMHGRGEVVHDAAQVRNLWHESWRAWFPQGPEDTNLVLLRIRTAQGEFWDHEGLNRARVIYDVAKSYLTGQAGAQDPALQGKVGLQATPPQA